MGRRQDKVTPSKMHYFSTDSYGTCCTGCQRDSDSRLEFYNGGYLCSTCKAEARHDMRQVHKSIRKNKQLLQEKVDEFGRNNNIHIKCMSDQIMLYYRYSISTLDFQSIPTMYGVLRRCNEIYEQIRGDMTFTNKRPRSVAVGIVYVACVMAGATVTQHEVAVSLDVTDTTIREHYKLIKKAIKI